MSSRIHDYQRKLGPLFTAEQADQYIAPALPPAVDPELRKVMQFWHDLAQLNGATQWIVHFLDAR